MSDNIRPPWAQDLANDLAHIRTQIQELGETNRQEIASVRNLTDSNVEKIRDQVSNISVQISRVSGQSDGLNRYVLWLFGAFIMAAAGGSLWNLRTSLSTNDEINQNKSELVLLRKDYSQLNESLGGKIDQVKESNATRIENLELALKESDKAIKQDLGSLVEKLENVTESITSLKQVSKKVEDLAGQIEEAVMKGTDAALKAESVAQSLKELSEKVGKNSTTISEKLNQRSRHVGMRLKLDVDSEVSATATSIKHQFSIASIPANDILSIHCNLDQSSFRSLVEESKSKRLTEITCVGEADSELLVITISSQNSKIDIREEIADLKITIFVEVDLEVRVSD